MYTCCRERRHRIYRIIASIPGKVIALTITLFLIDKLRVIFPYMQSNRSKYCNTEISIATTKMNIAIIKVNIKIIKLNRSNTGNCQESDCNNLDFNQNGDSRSIQTCDSSIYRLIRVSETINKKGARVETKVSILSFSFYKLRFLDKKVHTKRCNGENAQHI